MTLRRPIGVIHRRAAIVERHEHVVAVQQLVRRLRGAGHCILTVPDDEHDLASVNAPLAFTSSSTMRMASELLTPCAAVTLGRSVTVPMTLSVSVTPRTGAAQVV